MFKIFLLNGIRQIKKFSSLSAITIFGLAVGFASVILLSLWVKKEYQYDRFYEKTNRLYKIFLEEDQNGKLEKHPWVPFPLAKALRDEIPEIVNSTILTNGSIKVKYNDLIFYEDRTCFTDAELFDVFDLKFIRDGKEQALHAKESIVITEKIAKKYFGDEDPLGKVLQVNDNYFFEISAVVKNIPQNSSISFDFFLLAEYYSDPFTYNSTNWGALNFNSYICLREDTDPELVRQKIRDILTKHYPERDRNVNIQPIKKSHFYRVSGSPANIKNVRIMITLGAVILLVALINFLNISLGSFHKRMLEFKTRGILGAFRKQIAVQIIVECLLTISISIFLAMLFSILLLPFAGKIAGLSFSYNILFQKFMFLVIGSAFLSSLLICIMPLVIIYSGRFNFLITKSNREIKLKNSYNSVFIIFQFASSILLIIGVLVVTRQLNFISNHELGLDPSKVVVMPMKGGDKEKYPVLKDELLRNAVIQNVSAAYNWPTQIGTYCDIEAWPGNPHQQRLELAYTVVDEDYFSTVGMTIVQGVPFSMKNNSDSVAYILNERAVKEMNLKDPVGCEIDFGCWTTGKVIGVVKDFNFRSMHSDIRPLIIVNHLWGAQYLLIKFNRKIDQAGLAMVESTWKKINPNSPFNYMLLTNTIDSMYRKERRFSMLLLTCSAIALILSAIGLFGIILMHTQRRIKEIGIRKVNGAKVSEILTLLNKNFIQWLVLAFVFASPLAWYLMNKWLENFVYRIDLEWWIFLSAGSIALIAALMAVSWQSWRAANRNLVEALRYE